MPWNPQDHKRDLIIEQQGTPPNATYRLTGWVRHTTQAGQVYLEPLPNFWALRDVTFNSLEVPHARSTTNGANPGELSLTKQSRNGTFGGRKA